MFKYESIQACRMLAALLVLWVHFRFVVGHGEHVDNWFIDTGFGGCGVDLFFVISGFVMVVCSRGRGLTAREFLLARVVRVLPLYFLYSAPFFIKGAVIGGDWSKTASTFLLLPVADFGGYTTPAHPCGWTIAFEVWFYLLFAAVLLNCRHDRVIPILSGIALGSLAFSWLYPGGWFLPRFLTCPLLLEFLAGCLLGFTVHRIAPAVAVGLLICSLLLYGLLAPRFGELTYYDRVIVSPSLSLLRAAVWGVPAWLLCAALSSLELRGLLKVPRAFTAVGNASYTLYLAQAFLIPLCARYLNFPNIAVTFILYIVVSVVASLALSRWVEYPLLRLCKNISSRWRAGRAGAGGGLAAR